MCHIPQKPANVTVQLNVTNAAGILVWEDADITETNISNAIQTGSNWNTALHGWFGSLMNLRLLYQKVTILLKT